MSVKKVVQGGTSPCLNARQGDTATAATKSPPAANATSPSPKAPPRLEIAMAFLANNGAAGTKAESVSVAPCAVPVQDHYHHNPHTFLGEEDHYWDSDELPPRLHTCRLDTSSRARKARDEALRLARQNKYAMLAELAAAWDEEVVQILRRCAVAAR